VITQLTIDKSRLFFDIFVHVRVTFVRVVRYALRCLASSQFSILQLEYLCQ